MMSEQLVGSLPRSKPTTDTALLIWLEDLSERNLIPVTEADVLRGPRKREDAPDQRKA